VANTSKTAKIIKAISPITITSVILQCISVNIDLKLFSVTELKLAVPVAYITTSTTFSRILSDSVDVNIHFSRKNVS